MRQCKKAQLRLELTIFYGLMLVRMPTIMRLRARGFGHNAHRVS
jgi:hypothetical protein